MLLRALSPSCIFFYPFVSFALAPSWGPVALPVHLLFLLLLALILILSSPSPVPPLPPPLPSPTLPPPGHRCLRALLPSEASGHHQGHGAPALQRAASWHRECAVRRSEVVGRQGGEWTARRGRAVGPLRCHGCCSAPSQGWQGWRPCVGVCFIVTGATGLPPLACPLLCCVVVLTPWRMPNVNERFQSL